MKTVYLLCVLLIIVCATPNVFAQNDSEETSNLYELSLEELMNVTVVSASKTAQDINYAPADMTVITKQEIEDRGYNDLKDVFRDLPGYDISENVEGEVRTLVISRGILGNNKIMIMRDGKKLNPSSGERFVYGNNIPLYNVERIEIINGPSSSMYGADAYAGIVNLISKKAEDIDGIQVGLTGGYPNTVDGSLLFGKKINDDVSLTLGLRGFFTKGFNLENYADYDTIGKTMDMPTKDYNIFAKADFKNVTIGFMRMDANEANGYSTNPSWFTLDKSHVWHQVIDKVYFTHNYQIDKLNIESSIEASDYEVKNESNFHYAWGYQYKYAKTNSLKWEEKINYEFPGEIKFAGGLSYEYIDAFPKTSNLNEKFDPDMLADDMNDWYINGKIFGLDELEGAPALGVHTFSKFGIYGDFTKKFFDNFQINAGVRYDKPSNYSPKSISNLINPRFSLIWNPNRTSIKLLYGEAYIQPSEYYKWENFVAGTDLAHIPNPNLEAETMRSFTLVVTQMINDNMSVGLTVYRNQLKNIIRPVQYIETNSFVDSLMSDSAFIETNSNFGTQVTQGFELKYRVYYRNISGYASYSFLNAEEEDGDPISKVSYHKFHAGITYKFLDRFSASPRVRFIGPSNATTFNTTNSNGVEEGYIHSRTVVDFTLNGKITDNISAQINAVNILNTEYYASSPFGEGPSGWIMAKTPQPRAFISFGLKVKF